MLNKLNKIYEEFYKGINLLHHAWCSYSDKYIEIFKNPTRNELDKPIKEFRAVRFSLGDALYVWNPEGLHADVVSKDPDRVDGEFQGQIFLNSVNLYANRFGYHDEDEFFEEEDIDDLGQRFLEESKLDKLGYKLEDINRVWN